MKFFCCNELINRILLFTLMAFTIVTLPKEWAVLITFAADDAGGGCTDFMGAIDSLISVSRVASAASSSYLPLIPSSSLNLTALATVSCSRRILSASAPAVVASSSTCVPDFHFVSFTVGDRFVIFESEMLDLLVDTFLWASSQLLPRWTLTLPPLRHFLHQTSSILLIALILDFTRVVLFALNLNLSLNL